MSKKRKVLFAALLIFPLVFSFAIGAFGARMGAETVGYSAGYASSAAESRGECVVEVTSRRFLQEKSGDMPLPMASTTKILTAILVIDDCALNEEVTIPQAAQGVEGSSAYLRAGEKYTVEDLLYGLMLRSGNDCAVALALHHSESIEAFAQKMNKKAALLGATDSYFCNPHGLPAKGHHTTARDLSLIACYAMENPIFEKIVSAKYYARHNWHNKNKMLWDFDGAIGVKTGFTVNAGRCLVTSAERNGMKLVCVVLNSPQMYERSAELLNEAFDGYGMVELCDNLQPYEGFALQRSFSYPLTESEREKISFRTETISPMPKKHGEFAGTLQIFLENDLIFSQNLFIM